jgi:hypothetical protein
LNLIVQHGGYSDHSLNPEQDRPDSEYESKRSTTKSSFVRASSFRKRLGFGGKAAASQHWGAIGLNLIYKPIDPAMDIVFVHGLRGGSIKTWCKDGNPDLFWPKTWLPSEPGLQRARIHSFGYNADWGDCHETTHDLCDFGRSLLGALMISPEIRSKDEVRMPMRAFRNIYHH